MDSSSGSEGINVDITKAVLWEGTVREALLLYDAPGATGKAAAPASARACACPNCVPGESVEEAVPVELGNTLLYGSFSAVENE